MNAKTVAALIICLVLGFALGYGLGRTNNAAPEYLSTEGGLARPANPKAATATPGGMIMKIDNRTISLDNNGWTAEIGDNTLIRDSSGKSLEFSDLKSGLVVNIRLTSPQPPGKISSGNIAMVTVMLPPAPGKPAPSSNNPPPT